MRWERHHFEYKDTIVTILSDSQFFNAAEKSLISARVKLESVIERVPYFKSAMKPISVDFTTDGVVKRMLYASTKIGVGPMAAVAGAFAENAGNSIIKNGGKECVVDNGGDISLFIKKPARVGIFTGESKTSNLAFLVEPRDKPFAICTSSGIVGHSFSSGRASAATVISENGAIADAAATALGNRVKSEHDLKTCFDFLKNIEEIEGALIAFENKFALWGELPEIISANVKEDIITFGH